MKKQAATGRKRKFLLWFWGILLVPTAALVIMLILTAAGAFGRLPSFEELENPESNLATEIYSSDGVLLGSFYIQNRSYVDYEELSPALVAALIATEDARFDRHSGIDFISLARVGIKTIALGNRRQGGGSTITQQLAKNLFPRDTTSYNSKLIRTGKLVQAKLKEWITAVKLERNYTKDEIVAMYLNTVFFGSNAYGIKSAAKTFFDKEPHEINVQEAAVLIGAVNAPTKYSPVRNPENSLARRNTVMSRMASQKFITEQQADSLSKLPIELHFRLAGHNDGMATYFREMIRQTMTSRRPTRNMFYMEWDYEQEAARWDSNPIYGWCLKNRKADGTTYDIYRDGLKIYTTLNSTMQRYAEESLLKQLREQIQPAMEEQYRYSKVLFQDTEKAEREKIIDRAIRYSDRYREMRDAGYSDNAIQKAFRTKTKTRIFTYKGEIDTLITPLDSILHHKRIMRASMMAVDPNNGHVLAYVGGPNFRYFKYDMGKQGRRQVGSTIKPFIYTFAFDHLGYNPCTTVPNLPVTIETYTGEAWTPKEAGKVVYDGKDYPLKWGMARSRNNYSAWIMKQAHQADAVARFIHNMGIQSYIDPVDAICLGTPDVSLFEMVGAYSTFVNRGVFTEPIFVTRIEDRHGNVLAEFTPSSSVAISEQTAYTMIGMLRTVVQRGTGNRLNRDYGMREVEVGGKTGTSQENRDAWFMCVTPNLVGGVWVGGEDQSVHLRARGEGSVVALPIFGDFLRKVYDNGTLGVLPTDVFPRPAGARDYNCWDGSEPTEAETAAMESGEDTDLQEVVDEKPAQKVIFEEEDEFFQ